MINEIFKNPTIVNINYNMIRSIKTKFTNKITIGDYIIERIVREKIYCGFGYKSDNNINKLNEYAENNDNFNLVMNSNEKQSGYSSFSYSIINKKPGILITNSNNGFQDIIEPIYKAHVSKYPLFIISLYNKNERIIPSKIENIVFKSYDMTNTHRFPYIFEYLFEKSFIYPTHLKINQELLTKNIYLDQIQYSIKNEKNNL